MILKFIDLFEIKKESDNSQSPNLTEERIYSFCQDLERLPKKVPVFSGATKNEGIVGYVPLYEVELDKVDKFKEYSKKHKINYYVNNSDCITIVADGNAGSMNYRDKESYNLFCMNISCIALFKKSENEVRKVHPEFDGLNLKWFYLRFFNYFKNLINGEGVQHFTKNIYKEIEIEIPKYEKQNEELNVLGKIMSSLEGINSITQRISSFSDKFLSFENKEGFANEKTLNYYLKHISRNDALSEQGIYLRSKNLGMGETINVLSGSTEGFYGKVPEEGELHFVIDKPCLHVVTRGKSGKIRFLPNGNYATNTNAMLITIKDELLKELEINNKGKEETYLKFLKIVLEPLFLDYCSSADLSVLPLTEVIKKIIIPFPKLNKEIQDIVFKYENIINYTLKLERVKNNLNNLFQKEILEN